ncbi:MAG TPA: LysR family transcriptional regulator [Vicinamibacterales bacterium]
MISSLVDTRYLEAFLAVCEEGTLSRASARLHKTQPALSYNLQRLEDALGVPLFERSGRRLILTPAGRRLRELGQEYAAAFQAFRAEARALETRPQAVRIATVSGFGRYVLYPRLRRVLAGRAGSVTLLFRTAEEVFRMVEAGDVDCGAVYHPKISSRLQLVPVYDEELVMVTPPSIRRPPADWRRLRTYTELPFVTYEESEYVFGRWFDAHFGRQPASGIVRWHVTELEEAIDAVGHGEGVSIIPRDAVASARLPIRIIRPGKRRCLNQVFRVDRVAGGRNPLIEEVFSALAASPGRVRTRVGA